MLNICNFFNRKFKYLILSFLFSTLSYSSELNTFVEQTKLYENPYWSKLLHYRNGESEIDSDNFFISKNGKYNLKEELFETINSLEKGTNSVLCRFPLRVKWLKENIPNLNITQYSCEELDKFISLVDGKFVTMVFPTAHINSPASMYGHTFIRISSNEETPLISNAVNYAAATTDTNGLIFAYKGLFGEYEGRYSILPYYEKIKEYNNLEQRDIWEYDLDLTQDEIDKLVLHTYELKDSYSDYFFFKENCSYNVLWLLEVARPSLDLVSQFDFKTVPLDSIKVLQKYNLIKNTNFRYSSMRKMKFILNEKIENKEYVKGFIKEDNELNDSLSTEDKISYLDLKISYLQYQRANNEYDKDEYLKKYLQLLKERSSYKQASTYDIKTPFNPIDSHDSARVSFFYNNNDSFEFSAKPVYNDMYDISDGYLQGAYIDFFDVNIKKEKDENARLDRFTLLKIKSLAPQDLIFKPISWGIDVGYEHFKQRSDYLKVKPEIGVTFGQNRDFIYLMAGSNLYYKNSEQLYSIGSTIGFITNRFDNLKLGINYSYDRYNKDLKNNQFEAFSTYKLDRNLALNIKYTNDNLYEKEDNLKVGISYYF
ncbi:DUF4105 domain-containing protein [Arcobacter ellisii]|uniref:DUF4105 domain-containing protein n=1 Tax=Arcobacter ellisii TaxID=913109 RepID=A0A347U5U4_9BACT|nr:DUF4105 domain-containing protein [Arcobacter ellisii]RXI32575.1 hypothetical protein CP962_02925 [Arcobacter ellisii]